MNTTFKLIMINFIFFIAVLLFFPNIIIGGESYIHPFVKENIVISTDNIMQGHFWTLLTSMFMHGSFFHLFVNMLSLFFLGSFLERIMGSKRFLMIYFIAGLAGGLFFVLFSFPPFNGFPGLGVSPEIMAVGASGAIFGLAGILAILTPRLPVYIMFIPIAMPMWFGITLALVALWVVSITAGLPIGNAAHLGGLIAGLIYAFYLRRRYKRKTRLISKYFS